MTLPKIRLADVLRNWQQYSFEHQPTLLKTFTAGLNHSVYLLKSGSQRVVLKVFAEPLPNAISAQQWAARFGLAPKIKFLSKERDLMIMEYVDSSTLELEKLGHEQLLDLGIALKLLHNSPSKPLQATLGQFELLKFCAGYLPNLSDEIHAMHKRLRPVLSEFINDSTPWTLCHNDLVRENCFSNQDQFMFIDWEYAQSHNPWFDLGAVVLYSDLSKEQAETFLDAYAKGFSEKVASPIYYSSQCAVLWVDILWYLAKFGMQSSKSMEKKWQKLEDLTGKLNIRVLV